MSRLLIGNLFKKSSMISFGSLLNLRIKNCLHILLTVFLDVMAGASKPKEGRIFFVETSFMKVAKKGWSPIRFGLGDFNCCTLFTIYI